VLFEAAHSGTNLSGTDLPGSTMARIDFYILPDTTLAARLQFACKLAETIWRKGYRLHLHLNRRYHITN
jgi:hypothetical protein